MFLLVDGAVESKWLKHPIIINFFQCPVENRDAELVSLPSLGQQQQHLREKKGKKDTTGSETETDVVERGHTHTHTLT